MHTAACTLSSAAAGAPSLARAQLLATLVDRALQRGRRTYAVSITLMGRP